jgi:hypothetical protein
MKAKRTIKKEIGRTTDRGRQQTVREVKEREDETRRWESPVQRYILEPTSRRKQYNSGTTPAWEPILAALVRGPKWTRVR